MKDYRYPLRVGEVQMDKTSDARLHAYAALALAERVERLVELFDSVIEPARAPKEGVGGWPARLRS